MDRATSILTTTVRPLLLKVARKLREFQLRSEWRGVFIDRRGRRIPHAPETRFRGNAFALMTQNRRVGVDVSAETYVPAWAEEPMDDDLVVEGLYQMEAGTTG